MSLQLLGRKIPHVHERVIVPGKRLGAQPPIPLDPRTLRLSKYIKALPPPPTNSGYIDKVSSWPMDLNDTLGDCTVAAASHMIQQWTTYAKAAPYLLSEAQVLDAYEAVSGYNPNSPNSDNGAVMVNVLRYWQKTGIGGHKITAYAAVNPANHAEMKQAVQLFGNVYIGIGLPITAQSPVTGDNGNPVWGMPPNGAVGDGAQYSWGGHCVPIVGYGVDAQGNSGTEVVTWGQLYDMTWGFSDLYVTEAWAVLSEDWIEQDNQSPSGFATAVLLADLKLVTA